MAFFKTTSSSKKKTGSSWSRWESSFFGGFLPTLLNHSYVKLPKEIITSVATSAEYDRRLFKTDVYKLLSMVIYYYFSLHRGNVRTFVEEVTRSPADLQETIKSNDYMYYFQNDIGSYTPEASSHFEVLVKHFRDLLEEGKISSIIVKLNDSFLEDMVDQIINSNLEIKSLIEHYKTSILAGEIHYEFPINPEEGKSYSDQFSRDSEGDEQFMRNLKQIISFDSLGNLSEDSIKLVKGGYGSQDACDPDLLKKTKFLMPSSPYPTKAYENMFGENYEDLSRQISAHLIKTLDITFDPTSDVIKSTRQGKIDSNKLVCATAGDLNVYQRKEENQIVRPFKVVMLGDESGSMCDSARIQAFMMEAYYNGFCEIMNPDDIFVYGHSGEYDPEIYIYNEPGVTDFKERIQLMDSKCENYDSPVIEKIHERVRGMTDSPILMLYFSDGAPSGNGYGGNSAEKELIRVSEKCKRDEFLVIGVGFAGRDLSQLYHFHVNVNERQLMWDWKDYGKIEPSVLKATATYNKAVKTVFC